MRTTKERRQYHFWIIATDNETKRPILIYGAPDENAARQRGLEMLAGLDFTLKRLPTSSLPRASSLLRGNRLEETHNLKESIKRQTHERGLKQKRKRQKLAPW